MNIKTSIKQMLPILFLGMLEAILIAVNYIPHTALFGWDNILPELNFPLNFFRNLTSVWQEYRGLGLLDGMSHASNLPHTIILYLLSFVTPQNTLRYVFMFLTHLLGGIGMYALISNFKFQISNLKTQKVIALIATVFYLYNPFTIQMFYTPLEAFSVHFAALPWIAYTYLRFLTHGKRRSYGFFLITLLLTTPQFFVTPFLFPVAIVLGLLSLTYWKSWKRILAGLAGFICINSFWLLPYLYGIPFNSPVIQKAKINQMSTDEVSLKNQAFGNLSSIIKLQGFTVDYQDTNEKGENILMLLPWRTHWNTPAVSAIYAIIFAIIIVWIMLVGIRNKKIHQSQDVSYAIPFFLSYVTALFFLGTDIPGIRELNTLLRSAVPVFGEAFRFTFTKFSLLYVCSMSILLAFALTSLFQKLEHIKKTTILIISGVSITLILYTALPAFQGNFFYRQLQIVLPDDYKQTFAFFQTQPPGRIAILPQPSYWSWKLYDFGYRGSGFFWYGLPQSTLDRAFDPWSKTNENYYWELSYAIYKKDPLLLDNIFNKYDISSIVLDEHLLATASHYRGLFIEETKDLLSQIPTVKKVTEFGKITIYTITYPETTTKPSGVRLTQNVPIVTPSYQWTDNDIAYKELGDYINQSINHESSTTDHTYPFRSLFSKRSVNEREFEVKETSDALTISSNTIPDAVPFVIDKNQALVFESGKENVVDPKNTVVCYPFKNGVVKATMENNYLRLQATDNRLCLNFGMPELWHREGYIVSVTSRHIEGRPLTFALINKTAKHTEIETLLTASSLPTSLWLRGAQQNSNDWQTDYFILPPLSPDGKGYDVYIANDAIGRETSMNDMRDMKVYTIPYEEMVKTRIQSTEDGKQNEDAIKIQIQSVEHPNPAYYKIQIAENGSQITENTTLILSQSFDKGWHAYQIQNSAVPAGRQESRIQTWLNETFPFLFGKEVKEHVMVNNWENAWVLLKTENGEQKTENTNPSSVIVLFFLPQLLEWIGFAMLPLPFFFLIARPKSRA